MKSSTSNIPISFKALLILILSIVITVILLVYCTVGILEIAKSNKSWVDSALSTVGNIIGGLIGGIVAYIVAAYQVKKNNDGQQILNLRNTIAAIRLIKEELDYNSIVIDSVLPYSSTPEQNELLRDQLSDIQWNNNSTNIGVELTDKEFFMLCDLYRRISLIKSQRETTKNASFLEETKSLIENKLVKIDEILIYFRNKL